jgi:alanine-glyoxylate transaminase/serine-glyoxylate transaminase/serine-pyruvate transaminase
MASLAQPAIGYLDPAFVVMMEELKELMRYAYQTTNPLTFPMSGPGSVGMEACFVNLVEPGDKVIVCRNGVFGGRMLENVERCGGLPVVLEETWGEPVDPNKLEALLKANPDTKIVAFVHAETSTGAQSDAQALCDLARKHGALTIVDCVTSLGGTPVLLDAWQADATYSGSQKCLSCTPGLSPISFSERAIAKVKARTKGKVQSWFMDLNLVLAYWGETARTYHHTAPGNSLYALHEALLLLKEEGLENAWARHRRNYEALKAGLEAMGLKYLVKEEARLPQLNSVYIPEGIDDLTVRKTLLTDYNIEIGAGLGPLAGKIWRFGLMGYSSQPENVLLLLSALSAVLGEMGYKHEAGSAEAAAHHAFAAHHAAAAKTRR